MATSSPHTHQWSARVMHSCGSGDGCRRARRPDDGLRWIGRGIPADAIESIARRRNRQVGKNTIDLQTLANRERHLSSHKPWRSPARSTHNAVRVTHTERLVLATVNVKSPKPKNYHSVTSTELTQTAPSTKLTHMCIKGSITREQQNFVAYTSGASGKGQLGVEARVHRSVPRRARVRTQPCSPRVLVLKIDSKNNMTVIVAHASPNDSGEQGRKSLCEWTSGNSQEQIHWELSQ